MISKKIHTSELNLWYNHSRQFHLWEDRPHLTSLSSNSSHQNYNQRQRLMTPNLRSLGSKEITVEVIGISQVTFDIPDHVMGLTYPQTGN